MKLNLTNLPDLPKNVRRPAYRRANLTAGIVHIGLGNFHRAHQAWYIHRLMQDGKAHDWAIIGAGVRPADVVQREKMLAQDCLTTLIELDPAQSSAEVIGSMIDYVPVENGNGPLIAAMADPAVRIVSLTVTESGYFVDPATGGFDAEHEDILHDVTNPSKPRTAFGAMIEALRLRRAAGAAPFTCQSCDNLQGNGAVLRQTIVSLARLSDPDLADWIDENCGFPNSMVDCIAPATGPNELALAKAFGVDDGVPVTHEAFRQWVIEDDFSAGRPPWEDVGATISDRVHDFETMKIRVLNAGHQVLANVGEILGIATIAECMAHPLIATMFGKVQREEIAPTVQPVPGMAPLDYVGLITTRFTNPKIVDTTRRVAFDGSARHPGFLHPIVRDQLAAERTVNGLALVEALWARMCEGRRDDGSAIEPNDPIWGDLVEVAIRSRDNPVVWLGQKRLYGDLGDNAVFVSAFAHWRKIITKDGAAAAMAVFLNENCQT